MKKIGLGALLIACFFTRKMENWNQKEIRSPSIIKEGNTIKMWYADNNADWFSASRIGYATYTEKCD